MQSNCKFEREANAFLPLHEALLNCRRLSLPLFSRTWTLNLSNVGKTTFDAPFLATASYDLSLLSSRFASLCSPPVKTLTIYGRSERFLRTRMPIRRSEAAFTRRRFAVCIARNLYDDKAIYVCQCFRGSRIRKIPSARFFVPTSRRENRVVPFARSGVALAPCSSLFSWRG